MKEKIFKQLKGLFWFMCLCGFMYIVYISAYLAIGFEISVIVILSVMTAFIIHKSK